MIVPFSAAAPSTWPQVACSRRRGRRPACRSAAPTCRRTPVADLAGDRTRRRGSPAAGTEELDHAVQPRPVAACRRPRPRPRRGTRRPARSGRRRHLPWVAVTLGRALAIAFAVVAFLVVSFAVARWLTQDNRERGAVTDLLRAQARGDARAMLALLDRLREREAICRIAVRANAARRCAGPAGAHRPLRLVDRPGAGRPHRPDARRVDAAAPTQRGRRAVRDGRAPRARAARRRRRALGDRPPDRRGGARARAEPCAAPPVLAAIGALGPRASSLSPQSCIGARRRRPRAGPAAAPPAPPPRAGRRPRPDPGVDRLDALAAHALQGGPVGRYLVDGTWLFRSDPTGNGDLQGWQRSPRRPRAGPRPPSPTPGTRPTRASARTRARSAGTARTSACPRRAQAADVGRALRVGQLPRAGLAQRQADRDATPAPTCRSSCACRAAASSAAASTGSSSASTTAARPTRLPARQVRRPRPPAGGWWNYGGILREVYLRKIDDVDFTSVDVRPDLPCGACAATVSCTVTMRNAGLKARRITAHRPLRRAQAEPRHAGDRAQALRDA